MQNTYRYIGSAHPFYQYGESYTLHIRKTRMLKRIWIYVERGKGNVINASLTRYKNIGKFNEDWVLEDGK